MRGTVDPPCRPSLPPLFLAAIGALGATCLAEELSWQLYVQAFDVTKWGVSVTAVLLAAFATWTVARHAARRRNAVLRLSRSGAFIVLVAFASAFSCALLFWTGWNGDAGELEALLERDGTLEADLTGDPAVRDYGVVSTAHVSNGKTTMSVRIVWPDDSEPLFAGHRISLTGTVSIPKNDEGGRWSHRNGFAGTLRAKSVEELGYSPGLRGLVTGFRDDTFARIATIGGDAAGLLAGVLLGNRTIYSGTELEQAFQTTGLAHLMAVSGTHLAIVSMLLSSLLARTPARRATRCLVLIASLVIYVAITGFAPSAIRACVMCSIALVLGTLRRRAAMLSGLSLCVFAFLGLSPPMAFSLGFQLSVLSVLGLVLFGELAAFWLGRAVPRLPDFLTSSVAATITASCMTLPVTVTQFAQLPLISPVANLVAAPLVTAALCLGVIASVVGLAFAPLGTLLLQTAAAIAACCAACVHRLATVPGACLPLSGHAQAPAIVFCVLFVGLWIIWPLPRRRETRDAPLESRRRRTLPAVCFALCLPVALVLALGFGKLGNPVASSGSRVVMLDVGQGDSMLVQSGGARLLVDTGEEGDVLLRELAEQGVTHLDAVVITHKDADHAGALRDLAGIIGIDHVYVHADLLEEEFMEEVLESARWVTDGHGAEGVRPGSMLQAGEFTLTIVAPQDGGSSENDDSLVSLLAFDAGRDGSVEARGLLTGDAESAAMDNVTTQVGDIDFLKVAHHGSKGGLTGEQLARLSPQIALISVGADNRYGHPNVETTRMLEEHGARIYRTDKQGAISIDFSDAGMRVMTER